MEDKSKSIKCTAVQQKAPVGGAVTSKPVVLAVFKLH